MLLGSRVSWENYFCDSLLAVDPTYPAQSPVRVRNGQKNKKHGGRYTLPGFSLSAPFALSKALSDLTFTILSSSQTLQQPSKSTRRSRVPALLVFLRSMVTLLASSLKLNRRFPGPSESQKSGQTRLSPSCPTCLGLAVTQRLTASPEIRPFVTS